MRNIASILILYYKTTFNNKNNTEREDNDIKYLKSLEIVEKTCVQSKRKCVKSHLQVMQALLNTKKIEKNREHILLHFITSRDKETSHNLRLDIMVIATTNYADIDLIEYYLYIITVI